MAGFGGGSDDGSADNSAGPTTCNLLIPSGNLVNALKHWQYKHKNSKLKEFLFMVTHSQKLITVSFKYFGDFYRILIYWFIILSVQTF